MNALVTGGAGGIGSHVGDMRDRVLANVLRTERLGVIVHRAAEAKAWWSVDGLCLNAERRRRAPAPFREASR